MTNKIKELEDESFYEEDSVEVPPPDIVAYNELRSCADLHRMHTQSILEIQPEFQREIVWKNPGQTRFVDSLIKQLPIPSMCFSLDYKKQKWMVVDGLQRMACIIKFLSDEKWVLSKLKDIDQKISGQSISKFRDPSSELNAYYRRVENLTLPITVLRCDYSKKSHTSYLFTIFHRLNAGGMRLNNQEIRNCIYSGPFNDLLKELNKKNEWMGLNRMKKDVGFRFTKEELILRVFAFHDRYGDYSGRLARFLNDYMDDNKNPENAFINKKRDLFNRTVDIVYKKIFEGKVSSGLTVTILESILVGVAFNVSFLEKQTNSVVQSMCEKLRNHAEFSEEKLLEGLAGKQRVIERISAAKEIFSNR